ncbi:MAG: T3SS effector HopA1 family protein [Holophagales bacterium]|nr:T3SS effector HopA1 family protein [Holophagales bacterium]
MPPVDTPWVREIERICGAVEIESTTAFTLAGERFAPAAYEPPSHGAGRLLQILYERCYVRPLEAGAPATEAPPSTDPDFARRLADCHLGEERWDPGWRVRDIDPSGRVTADKLGATRVLPPGAYVSSYGPYWPIWPGVTISAWLARGSFETQPGFYFVHGATLAHDHDPARVLRLYWNVRADGAPRLLAALARGLDGSGVPFCFKTLSQPEHYADRTDGSVLYVDQRDFSRVAVVCAELLSSLATILETAVPLFSKRLAPGLAVAEDPGNGDSFGLSRCRILAAALFDAFTDRIGTSRGRLARVEEWFDRHGLSLAHPHLNPGSIDYYELPPAPASEAATTHQESQHAEPD